MPPDMDPSNDPPRGATSDEGNNRQQNGTATTSAVQLPLPAQAQAQAQASPQSATGAERAPQATDLPPSRNGRNSSSGDHAREDGKDDGARAPVNELTKDQRDFLKSQARRLQWKRGNARRSKESLRRKRCREVERREQMNRGLEELAELCYAIDPSLHSGRDVPDPNVRRLGQPELLKNRGQLIRRVVKVIAELHEENNDLEKQVYDLSAQARIEGNPEILGCPPNADGFWVRNEPRRADPSVQMDSSATIGSTMHLLLNPVAQSTRSPLADRFDITAISQLAAQQTLLPRQDTGINNSLAMPLGGTVGMGSQPLSFDRQRQVAPLANLMTQQSLLIQSQLASADPPPIDITLAHRSLLHEAFLLGQASIIQGSGPERGSFTDTSAGEASSSMGLPPLSAADGETTAPFHDNRVYGSVDSGFWNALTRARRPLTMIVGEENKARSDITPGPEPVLSIEHEGSEREGEAKHSAP